MNQQSYMFSEFWGYFRQFLSKQLNSQPSCQTTTLETAAFSGQQLFLHSQPQTA
jgi:hypothetical protein